MDPDHGFILYAVNKGVMVITETVYTRVTRQFFSFDTCDVVILPSSDQLSLVGPVGFFFFFFFCAPRLDFNHSGSLVRI